ncbi:MAG: molecular chaperone HtpG [Legionellales bacterium]|nr:molecular chaperone HtpG [Legionellales bacterium]OUX67720.1 MAG: molecular chaperone HtpG [bacterium TMED178]|tara:strand:- start:3732 stop:5612 length:1881 start_codon:yes stop_codon:yes gene_type:complete
MVSEVHQFSADVNSVLKIVVESLYKNDEVFLRELISNASDALEKRRYQSLQDSHKGDEKLGIEIKFDDQYIEVIDNGIGMNKEELIQHLGQIAHSGTKATIQQLQEAKENNALIGQFGVGFYSAFVVADEVIVKTRKLDDDKGWIWITKTDENSYSIDEIAELPVGTSVRLKLKENKKDFANHWKIQQIIQKYSDHISFPITMYQPKDADDKDQETPEEVPTVVNKAEAIWTRSKKQNKEADYFSYYQHINHHDPENPALYGDFRVEGKVSYNSIVFVPQKAPFDLWHREHQHGLKLYVQRVFIQDEQDALLPMYLRFVKGMVDTQDLSLNVSREMLQNSPVVEQIKASLTKKVLGLLTNLAKDHPEKYLDFWKQFGAVIKEGIGEDFQNRDQIVALLRFKSSTRKGLISLKDYTEKVQKDQKTIYYLTTDRMSAGLSSPHLEIFNQKNIEVLMLDEKIDEWLVSHLRTFESFSLQSIAHGGLDHLSDKDQKTEDKDQTKDAAFSEFFEKVKGELKDKIKDVKSSTRLTNSPCCLISDQAEMSSHLKRILKEAGQDTPDTKPIFEINTQHPLVQKAYSETETSQFQKYVQLLYGQALLMDGEQLEDPSSFVKTMNELMTVDVSTSQ